MGRTPATRSCVTYLAQASCYRNSNRTQEIASHLSHPEILGHAPNKSDVQIPRPGAVGTSICPAIILSGFLVKACPSCHIQWVSIAVISPGAAAAT